MLHASAIGSHREAGAERVVGYYGNLGHGGELRLQRGGKCRRSRHFDGANESLYRFKGQFTRFRSVRKRLVHILGEDSLEHRGNGRFHGEHRIPRRLAYGFAGSGGIFLRGMFCGGIGLRGAFLGGLQYFVGFCVRGVDYLLGASFGLFHAFAVDFLEQILQVFHIVVTPFALGAIIVFFWRFGQVATEPDLLYNRRMNAILLIAAAAAPFLAPPQNDEGRLPARQTMVPCESEKLALDIKQWEKPIAESRWAICLDGEWNFKWRPSPAAAEWKKEGRVAVPGNWQLQGDYDPPLASAAKGSEGAVGLYSTVFSRPWRWWFRRTVLHFDGIAGSVRVRVNGKDAGAAVRCRDAVEFDLTDFLKVFGSNSLEVEVFGSSRAGLDGWRLAGIDRSVYLFSEHAKAPRDFRVETWIADDMKTGRFKVLDEKGGLIKERAITNLCAWSPEFPYVYITPIRHKKGWWIFGGTDHYATTIGFRRTAGDAASLDLNGARTSVRGVDMRGMSGPGGTSLSRDDMVRDIKVLKSFNFNAVRISGGPVAQDWYDLCDREGIMVFGDSPAACVHPCVISAKAGRFLPFADRSIWRAGESGRSLWRGDGDGSGLFDALRNPRPAAFAAKHANQCVAVTAFDFETLSLKVKNRFSVMDLAELNCVWQTFDKTGASLEKNMLFAGGVGPGEEKEFTLKAKKAEEADFILFTFFLDRECVGWNEFSRPFKPVRIPVGTATSNPGFKLNFWRAPTPDDIARGMPVKSRAWKDATISQKPPPGVRSNLKFAALSDGSTLVDWTLVVPPGLPPVPRIGLSIEVMNDSPTVEYLGYGPWENYSGTAASAIYARYAASVGLVNGIADPATGALVYPDARLNPDNGAVPGEQGYRTGCRWLRAGGKQFAAFNAPFGFNVWPYPQSELEGKDSWSMVKESNAFTVNIDAAQSNPGEDGLGAGTYRLVFAVSEAK